MPKIITEASIQTARDYFNCQELNGVELESDWSHLKKTLYFDNIMSPIYTNEVVLSTLEFMILHDMYFYQFDFSLLNESLGERSWGKGLGCSFVLDNCLKFHTNYQELSPFP